MQKVGISHIFILPQKYCCPPPPPLSTPAWRSACSQRNINMVTWKRQFLDCYYFFCLLTLAASVESTIVVSEYTQGKADMSVSTHSSATSWYFNLD